MYRQTTINHIDMIFTNKNLLLRVLINDKLFIYVNIIKCKPSFLLYFGEKTLHLLHIGVFHNLKKKMQKRRGISI